MSAAETRNPAAAAGYGQPNSSRVAKGIEPARSNRAFRRKPSASIGVSNNQSETSPCMREPEDLYDKGRQHGGGPDYCIVLAMLEIQLAREPGGEPAHPQSPRQQTWHAAGVVLVAFELLAQKCLFCADYRHINRGEQQNDAHGHPDVACGNCKANGDDDRATIKRIAAVGIGPRTCQLL